MTEPLQRDALLELLSKLGSADDEEVLTAARQLHADVEAAEVSWDELIVPEPSEEDFAEEDEEDDDEEEALDETEDEAEDEDLTPDQRKTRNSEALALIDKLLAAPGRSDALKEELEGYKEDIAEGEFTAADLRYVRALAARLGKQAG
ncbi:hypothetical protein [Pelagibius sp.]|uniref:hypothetical protein n=1 Tax=Pelagibius sp. TaxID=1931238 RepID=UPI00260BEDB9|nr:hypothetical protein [Pelagibius sp.]